MTFSTEQVFFYILIRSWGAFTYFDRCIDSVFNQKYRDYKILFIDDASGYSIQQKKFIKHKLKDHIVKFNRIRKYSLRNAYEILHKYATNNDAVVVNLDGDDWLSDNNALAYLSKIYQRNKKVLLTYGECLLWDGKQISNKPSRFSLPYVNRPYSKITVEKKFYRLEPFLPLHPRTWKAWLFKKIKKIDFLRSDGSWLQFAEDQAIFYPMLEMATGNFKVIKKPLYIYNVETKNSDAKKNLINLTKDELVIRKKRSYEALI